MTHLLEARGKGYGYAVIVGGRKVRAGSLQGCECLLDAAEKAASAAGPEKPPPDDMGRQGDWRYSGKRAHLALFISPDNLYRQTSPVCRQEES